MTIDQRIACLCQITSGLLAGRQKGIPLFCADMDRIVTDANDLLDRLERKAAKKQPTGLSESYYYDPKTDTIERVPTSQGRTTLDATP